MTQPPPDIVIRPATVADAPQLARLLRSIGWFSGLQGMTLEALEASVQAHLEVSTATADCTTLVAEVPDGTIVGYCAVHWLHELFMPGPEGYLSELFLRPEARGNGLGTTLLDRVVAEAEERGAYRLMLLNGRHRESYERGFYAKQGWEEREGMANFAYRVGKLR